MDGPLNVISTEPADNSLSRCCVYSFWAPDDGRRNRQKHV